MNKYYDSSSPVRRLLSFDKSSLDITETNDYASGISVVGGKKRLLSCSSENQRTVEDDLRSARTLITQLEAKLASAELSRKKSTVEYDQIIATLKREREKETDEMLAMRHQLEIAKRKEEDALSDLKNLREDSILAKSAFEQRILSLQKENGELEAKLDEIQQISREQIRQLRLDGEKYAQEQRVCSSKLEEAEERIWQLDRKLRDCNKQIQELEVFKSSAEKAEHTIRELEMKLSQASEASVMAAAMKSQLSQLSELTKENKRLRDENEYNRRMQESTLVLREQVLGLEQKLEREEAKNAELTKERIKFEELQKKLKKLETECEISRDQSPIVLKSQLAELQKTNSLLLEKQGQLQTALHAAEISLKTFDDDRRKVEERLKVEEQKVHEQTVLIRRLHRKQQLLVQERDSYRQILSSYENETTVNMTTGGSQHVQQMESLVESYKKNVQYLENELQEQSRRLTEKMPISNDFKTAGLTTSQGLIEVDARITLELRNKIAELEKLLEKEREEKEKYEGLLEQRHMQGDFDPTTTRVIHFARNPVALARERKTEEFERLRKENEQLVLKIKSLEQMGGRQSDEVSVLKTMEKVKEQNNKEIEGLRSQLNSAKLKNDRLMEVFQKTSKELREAVYQLLGYRLDVSTSGMYKLMNMYAESQDHVLLFQHSPQGDLQLLANDYSLTLDEKIDYYLSRCHSIPAFLSSLTLDLFSRQTMMQSASCIGVD